MTDFTTAEGQRRLTDAVDRVEIRALHDAYADIVSRRNWADLAGVFVPDIDVDLDLRQRTLTLHGPGEVGTFIRDSIEQFEFFQFVVLNTRMELRIGGDPDRANARLYMSELRQSHDGHWSQVYGVYHDRFQRIDGQWWFAHRTYHSLARNNMPAALFDFPSHLTLDSL